MVKKSETAGIEKLARYLDVVLEADKQVLLNYF